MKKLICLSLIFSCSWLNAETSNNPEVAKTYKAYKNALEMAKKTKNFKKITSQNLVQEETDAITLKTNYEIYYKDDFVIGFMNDKKPPVILIRKENTGSSMAEDTLIEMLFNEKGELIYYTHNTKYNGKEFSKDFSCYYANDKVILNVKNELDNCLEVKKEANSLKDILGKFEEF